jgi:GTP cyclohydrolase I
LNPVPALVPSCRIGRKHRPARDLAAAEQAAAAFLTALGVRTDTDATQRTAARMTAAYAELLTAEPFDPTDFDNTAGYRDLVLARGVEFRSICAHHLLPFGGVAHVGYLPGRRLLGLSKLARAIRWCAAAPQVQEELTVQVADWLVEHVAPEGAGVVMVAAHGCMTLRGVCALGSSTVTIATRGRLDEPAHRAEFLALAAVTAGVS